MSRLTPTDLQLLIEAAQDAKIEKEAIYARSLSYDVARIILGPVSPMRPRKPEPLPQPKPDPNFPLLLHASPDGLSGILRRIANAPVWRLPLIFDDLTSEELHALAVRVAWAIQSQSDSTLTLLLRTPDSVEVDFKFLELIRPAQLQRLINAATALLQKKQDASSPAPSN